MQKVVGRLARRGVFLVLMVLVGSCGAESEGEMTPPADGADVEITTFVGAGVQLEFGGVVIHVDPWSRGDYSNAEPADLILITDTPGDHLDPDLIQQLRKPGPPSCFPPLPETRGTMDRATGF